jgi:DNA-binding transcriptional activator of the SARP family
MQNIELNLSIQKKYKFMYKKTSLILIFIMLFSLNCISQGLQFGGHNVPMKDRTTFSVFAYENPTFKDEFEINFIFTLYELESFGCIFLLDDKSTGTEYNLMYAQERVGHSILKFNIGGKNNLATMPLDQDLLEQHAWINFSLKFNLVENYIQIKIGNDSSVVEKLDLPETFQPRLIYGFNKNYVDLPYFGLRNLIIKDKETTYSFPFKESNGEDVHDSSGKTIGKVQNPIWLINSSYYWKCRFEVHSRNASGLNYYNTNQEFIFFTTDSIQRYDICTHELSSFKYNNLLPIDIWTGSSFIDTTNNRLYAYEVSHRPKADYTVTYLDLNTYKWHPANDKMLPIQLHHHSGFVDNGGNRYLLFGGFGDRRYNDQLISYDLNIQKWDTISYSGEKIEPRYFQGMGEHNGSLYILGGMGNDTGDQTIGRRNFYDLFKLDLNTKECAKLWEIDWKDKNVVLARNTVILNDSLIYALCYPEYESYSYVQLYEFSTKDGSYRILGDSIHFRSDEIRTNINLYYNNILKEFYCTIHEFKEDGSTLSKVYSLSYPAILKDDLSTYDKMSQWNSVYIISIIFGIIILITLAYIIVFRRKTTSGSSSGHLNKSLPQPINLNAHTKNAILLFGEFTIYNESGRDITYMMSNRLKSTFLLILEHSLKNDGITSPQLNEILWSDKDEYSAKNLRGVTINQLRKVLSELVGVELIYDKGLYKLTIGDNCFCDCYRVLQLIDPSQNIIDKYNEISNILSRGPFLDSCSNTFVDSFKDCIKEKLIVILPIYIEDAYNLGNHLLTVHMAENLLLIDPLNEIAFTYLIRSLHILKQDSEVKTRYTLFKTQYQKLTNTQFTKDLNSIIEG